MPETATKAKPVVDAADKFYYEMLYLVPGRAAETDVPKIASQIRDEIGKVGGEVTHEGSLGKRRLAYPIDGNAFGYYQVLEFKLAPEAASTQLAELDGTVKLRADVMRHQTVQRPHDFKKKAAGRPSKPAVAAGGKKEEDKAGIEKLDEKLDELLEKDITK